MNYRKITLIVFCFLVICCSLDPVTTSSLRAITMLAPKEKSIVTQPEIAFSWKLAETVHAGEIEYVLNIKGLRASSARLLRSATSSVSVWLARNESFRAQVVTNIDGIEYYSMVLQFATSDNVTELEQLENRYDIRRILQNPLGNADEINDYLTPNGAYFFWDETADTYYKLLEYGDGATAADALMNQRSLSPIVVAEGSHKNLEVGLWTKMPAYRYKLDLEAGRIPIPFEGEVYGTIISLKSSEGSGFYYYAYQLTTPLEPTAAYLIAPQ